MGKKRFDGKEIISASEIGQYTFCSVSWYLQKLGYKPDPLVFENGIKKHRHHSKVLDKTKKVGFIGRFVAVIGYLILFVSFLFLFFEVFL